MIMMENKKSYLHKNPGLTLIEVIISVALLAILSVPIFTMVNTNVKLSQKTELRQQATIIGQRILEYLGSIKDVTLGDNDVLSSLGVDIAFEKPIDSDEVIGNGITSDKFKVAIQMKNIIQNVTDETPSLTVNDLMKNPLFVITEQSNYLNINGELMADDLSLMIEHNVVRICDQNLKCVEKPIMNNQVTIYVQGKIANSYKILVEN
ncbi:prepilin-type N-terminal cleavage/methylation domain-containing protein, partial [Turicibacter sanguinis]|nr:prepilin-type N-terminal cleavage/methylation domain-containing protein [Turicibacter sanguinis]